MNTQLPDKPIDVSVIFNAEMYEVFSDANLIDSAINYDELLTLCRNNNYHITNIIGPE